MGENFLKLSQEKFIVLFSFSTEQL